MFLNMRPAPHNPVLCACEYDDNYEEFEFNHQLHRFIPYCQECGSAMQPHHNGIWECSESVRHVRMMYFAEDFPPFFGEDPEDD